MCPWSGFTPPAVGTRYGCPVPPTVMITSMLRVPPERTQNRACAQARYAPVCRTCMILYLSYPGPCGEWRGNTRVRSLEGRDGGLVGLTVGARAASINPAGSEFGREGGLCADRPREKQAKWTKKGMGIHRTLRMRPRLGYLIKIRNLFCLWMAKLAYDLHRLRDMGNFYEEVLVDNHTTATIVISSSTLKSARGSILRFSDLLAYTCDTQTLRRCGGTNRNKTHGCRTTTFVSDPSG